MLTRKTKIVEIGERKIHIIEEEENNSELNKMEIEVGNALAEVVIQEKDKNQTEDVFEHNNEPMKLDEINIEISKPETIELEEK
jgi:hypothetical protein